MVFFCFLSPVFLEQPILIGLYFCFWTTKNHEKILDNSRLRYLSRTARTTLISVLVMELRKSEDDATAVSKTWSSFFCALFSTT